MTCSTSDTPCASHCPEFDQYKNSQGEWKEWLHTFYYAPRGAGFSESSMLYYFQDPLPWVFPETPDLQALAARDALGVMNKYPGWSYAHPASWDSPKRIYPVYAVVLPKYQESALAQYLVDRKRSIRQRSFSKTFLGWLNEEHLLIPKYGYRRKVNENTGPDQSSTDAV